MASPIRSGSITIGTDATTIITQQTYGSSYSLQAHLENTGSTALATLTFEVQHSKDGDWETKLSGSDWGTVTRTGLLSVSTTRPDTLAGSGTSWFWVLTGPVHSWRLRATVGSGTTTVELNGYHGGTP